MQGVPADMEVFVGRSDASTSWNSSAHARLAAEAFCPCPSSHAALVAAAAWCLPGAYVDCPLLLAYNNCVALPPLSAWLPTGVPATLGV